MADPTSEELDLLLELQATDHRLRKARHQLDELPEQQLLEDALARAGTLSREHDDVRVELERASARQRQLEREVEVLTQRRDAERARLYDGTVGNAREMKAVEAEIETTIRRIDEHEELLLEVLEAVEALETRAADLVVADEQVRSRATELEQERDEAAKHVLAELGELQADRDRRAAQLPADLLARYEAAAVRAGGTGVGKLVDNACTACRLTMSRADVGELLAGPPLTTCPQCRRLLVVPS
ncbi:MAG: zinc ribbon domain-containing protein [Nitriliruptoraceae bacterium]